MSRTRRLMDSGPCGSVPRPGKGRPGSRLGLGRDTAPYQSPGCRPNTNTKYIQCDTPCQSPRCRPKTNDSCIHCNCMNVVTGLCHSSKWKSRYLSESFVLNVRSAKPSKSRPDSQRSTEIRDSTCPRSTAKYYRSHVIAIVSPGVTQP